MAGPSPAVPMSLFRRRSDTATLEPAVDAPALLCNFRSCASHSASPCSYRDRRGRECGTAFCPDHGTSVEGRPYCKRHGSTVLALGSQASDPLAFPDVGNRAPSLVSWVANDLDTPVRDLLSRLCRPEEQVLTDDEVTLLHDQMRTPRWERSWRLVDHTGVIVKVTVVVGEDDDALVRVRVGSEDVVRAVPPWIERRRLGLQTSPDIDSSQRKIFYRFIEENIAATAERMRVANDRPIWTT
jgi:hypothetical protein